MSTKSKVNEVWNIQFHRTWQCDWAANVRYTYTKLDIHVQSWHWIHIVDIHCISSVVCVALHNTSMWQNVWTTSNINFWTFWHLMRFGCSLRIPNRSPWKYKWMANMSCLGLGVYKWCVEEDRRSRVWISDVKVKEVVHV